MSAREVRIKDVRIGGGSPVVLIAGPCVIESESSAVDTAKRLKEIALEAGVPFIFKSSFDKANRLSLKSFRGPGLKKGLKVLARVKKETGVPVLSDVHCVGDIREAAKVLDVIQIPALLCRQTDLVVAAARTGKAVNIKKGQFMAPWDMRAIVQKAEAAGNRRIILTERGVSFGYNNLVVDFRGLKVMREWGYPVVFDATHSVQLPGGRGSSSGGQREFVSGLARAAVAFGCDGLFLEVHSAPDKALCDGPNMIDLKELKLLLSEVKAIEGAL